MKRIRLDHEAYEEGLAFAITIATAGRLPRFREDALAMKCKEILQVSARKYSASIFAYCFMPDHLHLVVAVPAGSDLITFIRHFKQLTSYQFRRKDGETGALWQRRFYDHALRRGEDVEATANYIWANPVRAGLVERADQYPFSGSFVWDLSGSEDPDLRDRDPPPREANVGEGLQTLAAAGH